jgi:hypothetical protein
MLSLIDCKSVGMFVHTAFADFLLFGLPVR